MNLLRRLYYRKKGENLNTINIYNNHSNNNTSRSNNLNIDNDNQKHNNTHTKINNNNNNNVQKSNNTNTTVNNSNNNQTVNNNNNNINNITRFEKNGGIEFLKKHTDFNGNKSKDLLIIASTGCGKTTEISNFFEKLVDPETLEDDNPPILISIPNRNSARVMCNYLNSKLKEEYFGYAIQGEKYIPKKCKVLFGTTGWLLKKIINNDNFSFKVFVLDESHDPSEQTYLLRKLLKIMKKEGKQFQLIISSATISANSFKKDFPKLEIFDDDCSSNYNNPIKYHNKDFNNVSDMLEDIEKVTLNIYKDSPFGTKLIILDGEESILNLHQKLKDNKELNQNNNIDIVTLYGAMEFEDQKKALEKTDKFKIIVATNIIESSITISDLTHVISCGFHKVMYTRDNGFKELITEECSKSNLLQQRGRGMRTPVYDNNGNLVKGYCYLMCTKQKYETLDEYPKREVDINPLYRGLIEVIQTKYSYKKIFDDIEKLRIKRNLEYLEKYELIKHDKEKNIYTVTESGRNITKLPTSIPDGRILYLTAQKLCENNLHEYLQPLCIIMAKLNVPYSIFYKSRQKENETTTDFIKRRTIENAKNREWFKYDDIETHLNIFYEYCYQFYHNNSHYKKWFYENFLFEKTFSLWWLNYKHIHTALDEIGIKFQLEINKDLSKSISYDSFKEKVYDYMASFAFECKPKKKSNPHNPIYNVTRYMTENDKELYFIIDRNRITFPHFDGKNIITQMIGLSVNSRNHNNLISMLFVKSKEEIKIESESKTDNSTSNNSDYSDDYDEDLEDIEESNCDDVVEMSDSSDSESISDIPDKFNNPADYNNFVEKMTDKFSKCLNTLLRYQSKNKNNQHNDIINKLIIRRDKLTKILEDLFARNRKK